MRVVLLKTDLAIMVKARGESARAHLIGDFGMGLEIPNLVEKRIGRMTAWLAMPKIEIHDIVKIPRRKLVGDLLIGLEIPVPIEHRPDNDAAKQHVAGHRWHWSAAPTRAGCGRDISAGTLWLCVNRACTLERHHPV